MVRDSVHKFVGVMAVAAAVGAIAPFAHAQGASADQASAHFPLDLITINITPDTPDAPGTLPAFGWGFGTSVTQDASAQSGNGAFPPAKVLILVSNQSNQDNNGQGNGFDLSTITSSGVWSGAANMNNTRFTTKEDGLNVVPLPPAALVGFGMLVGIAGVRHLRNRK